MYSYDEDEQYFDLDENFEFNSGFNKLIDQEVEKRVNERVKGIEKEIEDSRKDSEDAKLLRENVKELSRQLIQDRKLHMKEGATEERKKLFGGFDIGETAWTVKGNYVQKDCEGCDGTGKVNATIKNQPMEIKCLDCNGYKKNGKTIYEPLQCIISEVRATHHKWEKECRRRYEVYYQENPRYRATEIEVESDNIYKTEEECREAAELKNNKK